MKEASFYKKADSAVQCSACWRRCMIPKGGAGFCRVRKNIGGKFYAMTYGKPCAYNIDPIEKKPFFHFWPGSTSLSVATVGCNFACLHCQNSEISRGEPGSVWEADLPPEHLVRLASERGCQGISYTYTEPTVFFEYCYDTGVLARRRGLYNNFVTNGYYSAEVLKRAADFLDAARIDLKGDEAHYEKVCGGVRLEHVLDNIKRTFKAGVHVEIITLVIPGHNDSRDVVARFADFLRGLDAQIPWHFTAFYPAYKMLDVPPTPIQTLEKMREWALGEGMKYVYLGNVPGHAGESTYCANCGRLVIERSGFIVTRVELAAGSNCPDCGTKIPIVGEARMSA